MAELTAITQAIIILVAVSGLAYLYSKNVKDIRAELIIAAIISLIWVSMSGLYYYREMNFVFFGLNLFSFVAWTAGLVILKEIFEALPKKYRWYIILPMYWGLLFFLEYIGYNYFMIQLTTDYTGLFGLNLMHMPLYGMLYYLFIGPVYLLGTQIAGVK